MLGLHGVDLVDLHLGIALELHQEFGERRRQRVDMGGVGPEVIGRGDDVFRVGRFKEDQPARRQGVEADVEQLVEALEAQVLDDMEGGDGADAAGRLGGQPGDGVGMLCGQAACASQLDIGGIEVDAQALYLGRQQRQPFAAATADVHQRQAPGQRRVGGDGRQVVGQPGVDGFGAAAEAILEGQVEAVGHGAAGQVAGRGCGGLRRGRLAGGRWRRLGGRRARCAFQGAQAGAEFLVEVFGQAQAFAQFGQGRIGRGLAGAEHLLFGAEHPVMLLMALDMGFQALMQGQVACGLALLALGVRAAAKQAAQHRQLAAAPAQAGAAQPGHRGALGTALGGITQAGQEFELVFPGAQALQMMRQPLGINLTPQQVGIGRTQQRLALQVQQGIPGSEFGTGSGHGRA